MDSPSQMVRLVIMGVGLFHATRQNYCVELAFRRLKIYILSLII